MDQSSAQPKNVLATASDRVNELTVEAQADDVLHALHALAAVKQAVKELGERLEAKAIEWIGVHGELSDGKTRWYVAPKKTVKLREGKLAEALRAIAHASGGDFNVFASILSTGAIKQGAAKTVLTPEQWAEFFWVDMKPDLATGEVKNVLQSTRDD